MRGRRSRLPGKLKLSNRLSQSKPHHPRRNELQSIQKYLPLHPQHLRSTSSSWRWSSRGRGRWRRPTRGVAARGAGVCTAALHPAPQGAAACGRKPSGKVAAASNGGAATASGGGPPLFLAAGGAGDGLTRGRGGKAPSRDPHSACEAGDASAGHFSP